MPAREDLDELAARLGVQLEHGILRLSLTHRSYAHEHGALPNNERLEFLGDSVLGLVVTDALYTRYPDQPESLLARYRSAVVNAQACAEVASGLGVGEFLLLGNGEDATGGRKRVSVLADAMEALIGAVYLDVGLPAATELVLRLFDPLIATAEAAGAGLDWKTSLQELTARLGLGAPKYEIEETGPDHAKNFQADAVVGAERFGPGTGTSKKQAEQAAAKVAYEQLISRPAIAPNPAGSDEAEEAGGPADVPIR